MFLAYLSYGLGKKGPVDIMLMAVVEVFIQVVNMIGRHV